MSGESLLRSRYRSHGGLTPALLVHVRLCIAKVAIPSAGERRANKSGGRKPPGLRQRACNGVRQLTGGSLPSNCGSAFANASARHTAGSRPPLLVLSGTSCPNMYVIVPATRFSTARQADARRSWCVCASQKSQFRRQTLASRSARAGGVSLPWFAKRGLERRFDSASTPTATRVAVDHVHATALVSTTSVVSRAIPVAPRNCACNNARRAHARRSCACTFVHRKSRDSVGGRTAREQERGA